MGFGGISIWQLLIILLIVVLVFGTKKLRNIGSDLGGAVGNFKRGMAESDKETPDATDEHDPDSAEQDKITQQKRAKKTTAKTKKKKTAQQSDADFEDKG